MNNKTTYNDVSNAHALELLQAVIPHTNVHEQKFFSIFIKANELINTINFFKASEKSMEICSFEDNSSDTQSTFFDMLNDIKKVATDEEKAKIEQIISLSNMLKTYNIFQGSFKQTSGSPSDILMSFLSPSQQEVFNTYYTMFNNGGNFNES